MKKISYSQFSQWKECPFRWKLNYIDRLRDRTENISSLFGTSMHEVLQTYIKTMYSETIENASKLDLNRMLLERMKANYQKAKENNSDMDITAQDMAGHYADGLNILDWFVRHRHEYFTKRGHELIGVEVPLDFPIQEGIVFTGYLDIVIRDTVTNRYRIYDIKTSHQGWNKYQKKDKKKLAQLVLYKMFYALQFDVDPQDIDVEFIIVKRKLWENMDFPQKRIQRLSPPSGTITQKALLTELKEFVDACFNADGTHKTDGVFEKTPSVKACKYCEYKEKPDICDRNKRPRRKKK